MRIEPFRAAERFLPTKSGLPCGTYCAARRRKGGPFVGTRENKTAPLRNARRGAADLSELLDRVIHRQGKDHYGQGPHGVIGDGAAEHTNAGKPDMAKQMYEYIIDQCKKEIPVVEQGIFGADMKISLLNDGPFTIILDSAEIC